MTAQLLSNLRALKKRAPALEARLRLGMASDHVREAGGVHQLRTGRSWHRLSLRPEEVAATRADLPQASTSLVFGTGPGELVMAELEAGHTVLAWDRDPWMLRLMLGAWPLETPLRRGRLRLALGADLLEHLPAPTRVVRHPVLSQLYTDEAHLLEHGVGERRALVCTGELFVEDLSQALRGLGYTPVPWPVDRLDPQELAIQARSVGASLVASINLRHGLVEATRDLGLPLMAWEIDPATDTLAPTGSTGHAHVFTWRRGQVEVHRSHGLEHVSWLPLAANPERRQPRPSEDPRYQAPVCFVGNSMVAQAATCRDHFVKLFAAWKRTTPQEATAALEVVLRVQRERWDMYLVPEAIHQLYPGFREAVVQAGGTDPARFAGEIAAAEKRLSMLAPLGRLGLVAWGDEGLRHLERYGVRFAGRAGHGEELTRIYSTAGIHVDVGRIYQHDIVTMRVFDVLACGGFLMAEVSEDLPSVLEPGVEVETWTTPEELVAKVRHYLSHPEEARALARRGQERVLRDHTTGSRVQRMLSDLPLV